MASYSGETSFDDLVDQYHKEVDKNMKKYQILKDLDLFVLDNSIRESTVAQLRGHTMESKWKIYEEAKKCGFKNMIVASYSSMTRVDDVFVKKLVEIGEDRNGLWGFSEVNHGIKNGIPDTENIPTGIKKMKEAGLWNVILEIDLGDKTYDFEKFTVYDMCDLIKKWMVWIHGNMYKDAKILINFRDLPDTMPSNTHRAFIVSDFLAKLPLNLRPFGLIFEEPRGKSMPEECSAWCSYIRKIMDDNNWKGQLLVHVHEKFGYSDVTQLEVLMNGATGIWASVCIEGAALGHASSTVTLINLVRLGNKKVLEKYKCSYLRNAAINVTRLTTGIDPSIKQPIYGGRALDFVYDLNPEDFDLAEFFGEEAPVRITTLASEEMICTRLVNLYGNDPQFTLEQAHKMKEVMLVDLRNNRKEEYMSLVGLALLFDRSGGSLTAAMRDAIVEMEQNRPHAVHLIEEVRAIWDEWDLRDQEQKDDLLEFDQFYNGFMAPYFACYRCDDTKQAMLAIDMDSDGQVDWSEFLVYLKWALNQYPRIIKNVDDLLDVAFRKGLIPAMRDELVKKQKQLGKK